MNTPQGVSSPNRYTTHESLHRTSLNFWQAWHRRPVNGRRI